MNEFIVFDWNLPIVVAFVLFSVIQLAYLWVCFARFAFAKSSHKEPSNVSQGVSVIVCARNESRFLKKHLPLLLTQNYPSYEVVLVDDNSDDGIEMMAKELQQQYPHLSLVKISTNFRESSGKKLALAVGVRSAKYPLVLLTDADCYPRSKEWITQMAATYNEQHTIVLGYGAYERGKGFLDKLVRFDTLLTAIQYFSFALLKRPYMGVGRNLMYEKDMFLRNHNYLHAYSSTVGGDDDLFVNSVCNNTNTVCQYDYQAHTVSVQRCRTFLQWITQKRRHLGAGKHYKKKNKFFIGLYWCSNFFFHIIFIFTIFLCYKIRVLLLISIGFYVFKSLSQLLIFTKSCNKLKEQALSWYMPFLELFFMVLIPCLQVSLFIKKQRRWK